MNPLLSPLVPIAQAQGRRLLLDLPDLPVPPDAPAGRVEAGAPGQDPSLVVFLGDEVMAGAGATSLAEGLPGTVAAELARREQRPVVWQTVAEPGSSSLRVHGRLVSQVASSADVVVLGVGLNDLLARHTTKEWRAEVARSLDILRRHPSVVVLGCPPVAQFPRLVWPLTALLDSQAKAFDQVSAELCDERGLRFVPWRQEAFGKGDFHDDGFHLSDEGYRRLARRVLG